MLNWIIGRTVAALRDRKGISAMEYGILAAALIGVIFTAVTALGTEITAMFNAVIADLKTAVGG
ncbi:MAG: Flp family type IVb pilin [Acetobacteraceae bacterium]|jgi:pilus assembly protein Flp/PilA